MLTMDVQGAQTFSYILNGHYLITHVHASTHIHTINAYVSLVFFMCSQVHEMKYIHIYNQPLLLKYFQPHSWLQAIGSEPDMHLV